MIMTRRCSNAKLVVLLTIIAAAPVVLSFLSACTKPNSSGPKPESTVAVVGDAQIADEFWDETHKLSLPLGAAWPKTPPLPSPGPRLDGKPGGGNGYEVGFGRSLADGMWFCAWQNEWLGQRTADPTQATTALRMMNAYKQSEEYLVARDAGSRAVIDHALDAAALGDPTLVSQRVKNNCGSWLTQLGLTMAL